MSNHHLSSCSRRSFLASGVAMGMFAAWPASRAMAEDSAPKAGGTLRIAVPGGTADSLDPHATQGQISDIVRFSSLFDGLSIYTPEATVKLSLAESMQPNADSTEWTVKLRPGIKTHAGTDFLADDVIHSVQRILDPNLPTKGAGLIGFVDPDKVEKIDDLTVRFTLKSANGVFPEVWANRYLRMVPRDFDPANPIGTGPFAHQSFTPGQESVFTRFEDYFGDKAWADRLVVSVINDNTAAVNALRGGQVDIIYTMPFSAARILEGDPELRVLNNPSAMAIPIYMRTDMAPFDDIRVRQAMRLIVDRKQMVAVALSGFGAVGNDMAGRTIAPCGESALPQRVQDIEEARRLLAEAGQSDLSVEMVTVNGTSGMIECAQIFAEQAKAAGVTVTVKVMEPGAYLANYGNWAFGVDFLADTYLAVASRSLLPNGPFNTSRWDDEEFNALFAQAVAISDPTARCATIDRMRTIEYERGGTIVWGFANILNGYRSNVGGMVPYSVDSILYNTARIWLS